MANFPTSLDTSSSLPNPTGTNTQNNPDHAALHSSENAAIIAAETKIGIGSSAPAANQILFGTGAGTSAWQGLTSAQLLAILSDETGTGSAVFATSPTLVTPKIDTINENTPSNGTTVGGVNLKSATINTSNAVTTASIAANAVTTAKLATGSSFQPVTVEQNPYKFLVYRNAAWTAPNGVTTKVAFDTKVFDTGTNFDVVTNNRFVAPIAGFYQINAAVTFTLGAAALGLVYLYKNGSNYLQGNAGDQGGATVGWSGNVGGIVQLAATDYLEVYTYADGRAGGAGTAPYQTFFSGFLVSAT